jgi:hypothetical protein
MSASPRTVPLNLGGITYQLAPLTFGALRQHSDAIRRVTEGQYTHGQAMFDDMAALVLASLQRLQPEFKAAELDAHLDWPIARQAVTDIFLLSFPQAESGEPTAVSPSGSSTGTAALPN